MFHEQGAIGQIGQRVMEGLVSNLTLGFFEFGYIRQGGDSLIRAGDWRNRDQHIFLVVLTVN